MKWLIWIPFVYIIKTIGAAVYTLLAIWFYIGRFLYNFEYDCHFLLPWCKHFVIEDDYYGINHYKEYPTWYHWWFSENDETLIF